MSSSRGSSQSGIKPTSLNVFCTGRLVLYHYHVKAAYFHPAYLTSKPSTSCKMLGWMKYKPDQYCWGNINNFRHADDTTIMPESEEELKSLSMKVKEENEEDGLKLNIQETKIMASGSITSWQIDGGKMETVADFILGGSKITEDGDFSQETKRRLLLGRKAVANLNSILKSRDITIAGPYNHSHGFSCKMK